MTANTDRRLVAQDTLARYSEAKGNPASEFICDPKSVLRDLLTDLLHYCTATQTDFADALEMAYLHHQEES